MKHISLLIPFIPKGIRCTMISRPVIGGTVWRGTLQVCCSLRQLPASQSRASITCMISIAVASARVEVGRDCHWLYHGFAKNSVGLWFHLCDHGSIDQGSSLYTCQDHLLWTATSRVVYVEDSLFAWSAEEDCVCQRDPIYFKVLREVAWNLGYPIALQFCLSPSDQWLDREG
jgi:hypothetical protein